MKSSIEDDKLKEKIGYGLGDTASNLYFKFFELFLRFRFILWKVNDTYREYYFINIIFESNDPKKI